MKPLSVIFEGDNLRYLTELRGSPLSRLFYNKATILLNEFGRFLSFYALRYYFGPLFLIIFFPLWILGITDLIMRKKWKIFVMLLLAGIPVYLFDKRELLFLAPIALVYLYIAGAGLIYLIKLIKKWQNKK